MSAKPKLIQPHPGMQTKALASEARFVLMGGLAGPGKTYGLVLHGMHFQARRLPAQAIIFRPNAMDLQDDGGVLKDARKIYLPRGAVEREFPRCDFRWFFPGSGRLAIKFAAIPKPGDELRYMGPEYGYIGWDQLELFRLKQFSYLFTRARAGEDAGYTPFVRATVNPVNSGWIRDLVDWWIGEDGFPIQEREGRIRYFLRAPDGFPTAHITGSLAECQAAIAEHFPARKNPPKPVSYTFIAGRREDNPSQDWESYDEMFSMVDEWVAEQLREGNWNAGPKAEDKIWSLPTAALFRDGDEDFRAALASGHPLDVFGAWDYGRRRKALCWIVGILGPGSPPTLWIVGMKLWTDKSAAEAAEERANFLEALNLDFEPGRILDAGDPSGWAKDSGEGWAETLRRHGVPLVDLRHYTTPEKAEVYWNSAEGFAITTDLVQRWLDSGRLRVRHHGLTSPLVSAIREWRLDVPEGRAPIEVNRIHLGPRKDEHSHPGDALRYLVAFVAMVLRSRGVGITEPARDPVRRHIAAVRAHQLVGSRLDFNP